MNLPLADLPDVRARWQSAVGRALRSADPDVAPLALWLLAQRERVARTPMVVGLNGPQGSGKSTLADRLVRAFAAIDVRAVALSIDDVYLTHAEQSALAAAHPGNGALEFRGYPGTHDVALGTAILEALTAPAPTSVQLPRYDKSAHGGRGDRAPVGTWPVVMTPVDLVLFEGWMLGFRPADGVDPNAPIAAPNALLTHYAPWLERLDVFVHLLVAGDRLDPIVAWRIDAEQARRARGEAALSDADARDYIERFLPAYRLWGPPLKAQCPIAGPVLRVVVGDDRRVLSAIA